jgi:glyoxylase-like metal-dependent hydrolase (beta-lactamase superfamily II)
MLANHPALRLEYAYEYLMKAPIQTLRDGDIITLGNQELTVIETPGHTPGSIVLFDEKSGELFAGDTILPKITPHITLHDPSSNPLGDYLESLKKIKNLNPRIAYPGHRDPIENPSKRALEIIKHHEERLKEIEDLVRTLQPVTGYEVAKRVKWRTRYKVWEEYPPQEKFFAMGEALAHLRFLELSGSLVKELENGVYYWHSA